MASGPESIPTGCKELDKLLNGGFCRGEVSLVYGEAATGKTTMVMQAATSAAKMGQKVLYVDSDHSFTHQRFQQISGQHRGPVSEMIMVFLPETFAEQRSLLESLESYVTPKLVLVVVDSMTSLYRAAFAKAESIFSLNRDLSRQIAYLNELSAQKKVAVLITSQVHARLAPPVTELEPVARRAFFHFSRTILRLRNSGRANIKEILLERSKGSDVRRTSCLVELGETGIRDLSA